ncbi:efflux RND transporter periplasmic adaptor subunit [Altererythrobacter sp. B11]|uniref:efflux RND transporter periplasmic adaptor subunit n=1 Tax=Altererythrobacter sp. B11 TaxID=2060312 RepID=UPI001E3EACF5|nr:efflux RND transporter periplasmic adaptor subunit [Altererythrobacter sp. B11]
MSRAPRHALTLALLLLAACSGDAEPVQQRAPAAVAPLVLQPSETADWASVSAEVATVDQAQALARIPGILASLSVEEGDYVQKGQAIGRITDSQLGYQSGAYGAKAAAAAAQATAARAEADRARFLFDNGVYAKARLEQAQATASAAQAQVQAARAQQRAVEAVAGQGLVLAPASGRVLAADVPAGSAVAPGMAIATITAGPVILRLDLPETLADSLRPGAAVLLDRGQRGRVTRIYPSVSAGQVRADAEVAGLDARLIGRRVAAQVQAGTRKALLVPAAYVTTRFGIDTVVLRAPDGTTATVPVQTAPSAEPGKVEVLSGVSAGDTLVRAAGEKSR